MNEQQFKNLNDEKSLWDLIAEYGSAALMFAWGLMGFFFIGAGIAIASSLFTWGSPAYVITILLSIGATFASIWASKKIKVVEKGPSE
jgi:hypothetical protein